MFIPINTNHGAVRCTSYNDNGTGRYSVCLCACTANNKQPMTRVVEYINDRYARTCRSPKTDLFLSISEEQKSRKIKNKNTHDNLAHKRRAIKEASARALAQPVEFAPGTEHVVALCKLFYFACDGGHRCFGSVLGS